MKMPNKHQTWSDRFHLTLQDAIDSAIWGSPEEGGKARESYRIWIDDKMTGMPEEQADWESDEEV